MVWIHCNCLSIVPRLFLEIVYMVTNSLHQFMAYNPSALPFCFSGHFAFGKDTVQLFQARLSDCIKQPFLPSSINRSCQIWEQTMLVSLGDYRSESKPTSSLPGLWSHCFSVRLKTLWVIFLYQVFFNHLIHCWPSQWFCSSRTSHFSSQLPAFCQLYLEPFWKMCSALHKQYHTHI